MKNKWRSLLTVLAVFLTVLAFSACSSPQAQREGGVGGQGGVGNGMYTVQETAAAMDMEEMAYETPQIDYAMAKTAGDGMSLEQGVSETELTAAADPAPSQRKLIRNFDVNIQTTKFDDLYNGIKNKVTALGGYIENSGVYNNNSYDGGTRNGNLCARVPDDRIDEFMNTAFVDGTITSMNENTEDVTLRYSELTSRVESLETEKERLNDLMKTAPDVESIIAIEARLSEVRSEIENIRSNLRNMDNRITYSTVWINIQEVKVIEPTAKATFLERIKTGFAVNTRDFVESLGDFVIWFITNIFSILLFAAIVIGVVALIKKLASGKKAGKKDKKQKKAERQEAQNSEETAEEAAAEEEEAAAATAKEEEDGAK